MRRQIILSLVLIAVLLTGGAGTMVLLINTKPKPPEADTVRLPLTVRAIKLEPCTTVEPIVGYGTAHADRRAWVAAQVAGEVVELADDLRSGSAVHARQALVRIDEREYRAALDRTSSQLAANDAVLQQLAVEQHNLEQLVKIAEEELAVSERELNRIRNLLEQGNSNQREADLARLQFQQSRRAQQTLLNQQALLPQRRVQQQAVCELHRAEVAMARLHLERCTIVAPFSGRLEVVNVELGEQVAPGGRLLSIVDPDRIDVSIELPISLRGRVCVDRPARLSLESRQDAFWTGRVARIAPSANELTRTFALFVEVDNSKQSEPLIPGMFVHARIDGPLLHDALIVPRGCIQDNRVFVCRDNQAFQKTVRVERHLFDRTVISGLSPGEIIITSNLDVLYDGAPVRVLFDEPQPSPAHSSAKTP